MNGLDGLLGEISIKNDRINQLEAERDTLEAKYLLVEDENARLKRIIAKELTENDELGAEFAYVGVLKDHLALAEKVIEAARDWRDDTEEECGHQPAWQSLSSALTAFDAATK